MSDGGKKKPSTSSLFHLAAGLASGATSSLLLQPADLLKTRLQQSPTSTLLSTLRSITSSPKPLRQLWRGTLPSTIRTSVGSALYFTSLNKLRTVLAQSGSASLTTSIPQRASSASSSALPKLSPSANLASGSFARAAVGFVMMPITVLKVRYESNFYAYKSLWAASSSIFRAEGLRGFFAGFGATAIRDAPYAGLYVVAYERGKEVLGALVAPVVDAAGEDGGMTVVAADGSTQVVAPTKKTSALLLPTINFSAGALAAAVATAITNPPDAIKTRLQLHPTRYHNTWQAAGKMLREEGVRSLFDGLGLRMVRKALSSAIAWCVYEEVIRRGEGGWLTKS